MSLLRIIKNAQRCISRHGNQSSVDLNASKSSWNTLAILFTMLIVLEILLFILQVCLVVSVRFVVPVRP